MKMEFEKPMFTEIAHVGPLTNEEIAALPDDALAEYLGKNGYFEEKRRLGIVIDEGAFGGKAIGSAESI